MTVEKPHSFQGTGTEPGRIERRGPIIEADGPEVFAPEALRASRRSEAAAVAAQHVDDLEREVKLLQNEAMILQAHIKVIEESNVMLHQEIDSLKKANERLNYVSSVIETRLHVATDVILGIKAIIPPQERENEAQRVRSLESVLAVEASKESPDAGSST